jgi:hypothetical protein
MPREGDIDLGVAEVIASEPMAWAGMARWPVSAASTHFAENAPILSMQPAAGSSAGTMHRAAERVRELGVGDRDAAPRR